ncbi:Ppx/GppA phosphatase family protein, partial [Enterococcus faecalis]|uniref:Ppx/GppA phosphatase family protein n=1 Tax=Enterococcus faecalis TaxID=1351 RepID=UPI00403F3DCB
VATSAVRESKNGEAFLQLVRDELKIDARMISGKEEARLIYLGVLWSMPQLTGPFVLVDIGGGSAEIILADRNQIHFAES